MPGRPTNVSFSTRRWSRASTTAAATNTSALFGIYRWGWGFSTAQDFNGDIALVACFASSWTPAMVRRWHADPFGFRRAWGEVPALIGSAPPATPPSTGTGVVTWWGRASVQYGLCGLRIETARRVPEWQRVCLRREGCNERRVEEDR